MVFVTGAANGLGAATARAFARAGASVFLMDVDELGLASIREELQVSGTAYTVCADVTRGTEVDGAIRECIERFGRIDVLVNNAGIGRGGPLEDFTEEAWDAVFDTNLKAMYLTCRRVIPVMRAQKRGAIVNVASTQAYSSLVGMTAYSASKAGVVGFTRALALEVARDGVRVVAVAPSTMNTPMVANGIRRDPDPAALLRRVAERHPVGRILEPAEVAEAIVFLAGPGASAVTGATLVVDGGLLAGMAGS